MESSNLCAICQKPASSCCAKCKTVYYCTREHQKEDWFSHKTTCGQAIPKVAITKEEVKQVVKER